MANSVYSINKGINKSIEFKGLKAQYIWYMGGCLVSLLVLFAILYLAGVSGFLCIGIIVMAAGFSMSYVFKLSKKYGEHGLMKQVAKRRIPKLIKCKDRSVFIKKNKA